jgi:purine-binding chemotaxis protein CheW
MPLVPTPLPSSVQFLTFFVADEEYGVEILRAREIVEFETLTKVPTMPACVRGVINLRGSVVPIVDLTAKLRLPEIVPTRLTCVVILEVGSEGEKDVLGLLVDRIGQVIEFAGDDVQPAPAFGTRIRAEFLAGMGRTGSKFVLLLNVDRLLTPEELLDTTVLDAQEPAELPGDATPLDAQEPAEVPGEATALDAEVPAEPEAPTDIAAEPAP